MSLGQFILIWVCCRCMSSETDRGLTTCLLYMFSTPFLIIGTVMYLVAPGGSAESPLWLAIAVCGILMILIGSALIPSSRRARRKIKSIFEIAGVRKEVTISEISQETGLDSEYIRKVITDAILYKRLYGSLENDLFVRDTSERPRSSSDDDSNPSLQHMSLFDDD